MPLSPVELTQRPPVRGYSEHAAQPLHERGRLGDPNALLNGILHQLHSALDFVRGGVRVYFREVRVGGVSLASAEEDSR